MGFFLVFLSVTTYAYPDANRPGAVTLSLLGGNYWFASRRQINNTNLPSADLAYNFDRRWAVELGWAPISTSQKAVSGGRGILGNLFTLDGIFRFNQYDRFQPYLMAGVGNLGLKRARSQSTQQGLFNAGIGTQFFAEDWVAFRGEVRNIYTTTQGYDDWMASLGLSFLIG